MPARSLRRIALVALAVLLAACNGLTVDQSGVYTSSPTQLMSGTVTVARGDSLVSVQVNGVPAAVDGENWSVELPLDGEDVFNAVDVTARFGSGEVLRERRTVVYGDGTNALVLPANAMLDDAVGLRLNDSSFAKIAPVVQSLTTIDPGAIAPVGTVVLDRCITEVLGVCTVRAKAFISQVPSISDWGIGLDSQDQSVRALVTLLGFDLDLHIDARVFGAPVGCDMAITADSIDIDGNYGLSPDAADPRHLDVNLVGAAPAVTLHGFDDDFVGGVCSVPGIEQIVNLFIGDVQSMMRNNLTNMLGDPDGAGPVDSPVAEATEGALANVHIAGPIGDALGLDLSSTIISADEDNAGLGLRATASFAAAEVAPGAPDLMGSVGWGDGLGALPSTTTGGLGYDVAVGASATGFNQLLAAETERGLLNIAVDQINGQPMTLKSLLDLVGAGGIVTEDHPVIIEMRPEVAPVVTTGAGPGGALAEMRMSGYQVTLRTTDASNKVLLRVALDFRTGVSMVFTNGELKFDLAAPADSDFTATILRNQFGFPDAVVEAALRALTPQVFGFVKDALPGFPLPGFVGLDLELVEIGRSGTGLVLFANLVPG